MIRNKPGALLGSLYVHLTKCAKILSKYLEANFNHFLGMELATDVIFLFLSSVNNDLSIYVFATDVGCEMRCVGTTEFKNIPYISARATSTIIFSFKETWIFRLQI